MKIAITKDNKEQNKELSTGLFKGDELYSIATCGTQQLYLDRDGKVDIPIQQDDFIVIHGGEKFVVGKSGDIEDNPPLRNPVCPEFNDEKKISLPNAKILGKDLKAMDDKFPQGRLFVDIEGGVDVEIKDDMRLVVQDKDSYFVIPSGGIVDDSVDVEECAKNDRRPPKAKNYRIKVDGEKHIVAKTMLTGGAILELAGKNSQEWNLNQKLKGGKRVPIKSDTLIDLSAPGIERFETVRIQAQQGYE